MTAARPAIAADANGDGREGELGERKVVENRLETRRKRAGIVHSKHMPDSGRRRKVLFLFLCRKAGRGGGELIGNAEIAATLPRIFVPDYPPLTKGLGMAVPFNDLVMAPPDIYPETIRDGERDRFLVPGYQPIASEGTGLAYRPGVLEIDTSARGAHFFDLADYERRRSRPETIRVLFRIVALGFTVFLVVIAVSTDSSAEYDDLVTRFAFSLVALAVALICMPFLLRVWLASRRDLELERAIPVDVPGWLMDWLAPLWDRVEQSISRVRTESVNRQSGETPGDVDKEKPFADAFWKSFFEGLARDFFGELGEAAAGAAADAALDRKGMARERLANLIRRHAAWRIARLHERAFGRGLVRVEPDEWSAGVDFADDRFPGGSAA